MTPPLESLLGEPVSSTDLLVTIQLADVHQYVYIDGALLQSFAQVQMSLDDAGASSGNEVETLPTLRVWLGFERTTACENCKATALLGPQGERHELIRHAEATLCTTRTSTESTT